MIRKFNFKWVLAALLLVLVTTGGMVSCKFSVQEDRVEYDLNTNPDAGLDQLLNETFRIDIRRIEVVFDYTPEASLVQCRAVVWFRMRPGQNRPVIHLDPAIDNQNAVNEIRLNGETLDIFNESDVNILSYEDTIQQALEFQRDLAADIEHTLEIEYFLQLPEGYPRFSSEVIDIYGWGNQDKFPTLNTPREMAHHYITFRVHSNNPYRCIGSGLVEQVNPNQPGVQQWTLDTERELPSLTVMFVLMPVGDTVLETRRIGNVDVRIMAFQGGASMGQAFAMLQYWIPELEANLGPFPMPRGLSIFLTGSGGGMEYYGGTISSLAVLQHEVFHMYFACSTINKTYRDLWMDEAVNKWYEYSANPGFQPIPDDFQSNIVSARSPVAVGFDGRAYYEGAQILQAAAVRLGGRDRMIAFLSYIHQNYSFAPFTTLEFVDYLNDYSGIDREDEFLRWLYSDEQTAVSTSSSHEIPAKKTIDMTPPEQVLRKYGIDH